LGKGVFDVAVLKLRDNVGGGTPFTAKSMTDLQNAPTSYKVLGFGPDSGGGNVFAPRSFTPGGTGTPDAITGDYGPTVFAAQPNGNQHTENEDAGGPAISSLPNDTGKVLAMVVSPSTGSSSQMVFFTQELQRWINLVSNAEQTLQQSHICRTRHSGDDY